MENAIPSVAAPFLGLSHNSGMAEEDHPPEWAVRFRAHMKRHKQSQEALGEQLTPAVGQGAVGHWLRGRSKITLEQFLGLCAAAGADPRHILFGQTSAQAALDTLKDHVLTQGPDKQFSPPGKPAETMPPKAPRTPKAASVASKQPKASPAPSERLKAR